MLPDIGGSELLVLGLLALIVFKPAELPVIMKKVGQFVGSAKRLAADFRASFDDMARQTELDELRREVQQIRSQATKAAKDPIAGVTDAMTETGREIDESLKETAHDPDFDYGIKSEEQQPEAGEAPATPAPAKKPVAKSPAKAPAKAPAKPNAASKAKAPAKPAPKSKAAAKPKPAKGTGE